MRVVRNLLLLGSLAAQTQGARRWVKTDDPGSALETEASTQALMSSATLYLSKTVPADELSAVRSDPTIVALENKGVSLEQLFGWLALSKQQELKAANQAPSLVQLLQTPDEILGLTPDSADVNDGVSPSVETEMRAALISPDNENFDPAVVHNNVAAFHNFRTWLSGRHENSPRMSSMTPEQKHQYRRRQALLASDFFGTDFSADENIEKAQELLEDSLEINAELDAFLSFLQSEDDVDWANTHRELGLIGTSVRGMARFAGAVVHNTAELFRQTWRTFRRMMASNERRCVAMQSDAEGNEARRVGLTSGTEMLDNNGGEVDDDEIERQIQRTEQVLASLEEGQEETEAELERDVEALRRAGSDLGAAASSGTVHAEGLNATAATLERVSGRVCRGSQHSTAGRLMGFLRSLRSAAGSALAIALPGYGMRGLSAALGLQGGFEEVIDFRNREIGYFRWGLVDAGPSALSVGFGSYSSVGWKGYKVNWTLQDAYQTAMCTPHTGNLPSVSVLPGLGPLSPGLGITYCTDADNTNHVWIPEPHGVNGVVFSAGYGASAAGWMLPSNTITDAISSLPVDIQWAQYWMFTSECFDSLGSLLRGMYTPVCASCRGAAEHARVSTLRAATHVLAFPLITEMLHTFIAWQYDRHVRPEGYVSPCSDMSTKNRQKPEVVIAAVSRNLARAAETIQSIDSQIGAIENQLLAAAAANPEMTESEEWGALMEEQHMCARHPMLPRSLAEDDTELDQEEFEDVRAQLNQRSRDELVESCHRFRGIRGCGWRTKESLVEALAVRASTFASEDEPFGLCRSDSDCPLPNQKCGHVGGVLQCKCLRDFCHRLCPHSHDICQAQSEGADGVRQVATEMRAFLQTQRMDVGAYVSEVRGITSSI